MLHAHQQAAGRSRFGAAARLQPAPQESNIGFYLVLLAILFEFGRPQDVLAPLKAIPIPTLLDVSILLAVFASGKATVANVQTKLWMGLLAFMALWVPFANNNYWAFMTVKDLSLYFFFYLGIITVVNSTIKMEKLVLVWVGVHGLLAINGLMHGGHGVGGWLGDENDFAMEMNVAVPFAFFLYQGTRNLGAKLIYAVLLGTFVLSSIATASRGGFLGLLAVGSFCWLYSPRKVLSLVLLAGVLLLVLFAAPQEYWDRMQTITDDSTMESGTAGQRMFTWGIGWEMFLGNPIFGVGQGNFAWTIGEYMGGRTWQTKSLAGRQAHSMYFTLLPELGLLGVFLYGAIVFFNFKHARLCGLVGKLNAHDKSRQVKEGIDIEAVTWFGNAILGALVGYLVTSTFISTLYYPTFWILTGLVVALKRTTDRYLVASVQSAPVHVQTKSTFFGRPKPSR